MKVFVYGSLCKNQENHHLLENAECLSEQAFVKGALYTGPSYYPMLIKNEQTVAYGELYEISEPLLDELDELEGYSVSDPDSYFIRVQDEVSTPQGTTDAFIYYWPREPQGEEVLNHDWKVHRYIQRESFYYLAYGSCMDNSRLCQHGVNHLFTHVKGKGDLKDYRLTFSCHFEDGSRADITEEAGAHVEGIVYEVGREALNYLYLREGVDANVYRPTIVNLSVNDRNTEALTFTVIEKKAEIAPPFHYAEEIHRGGSKFLSDSYRKTIEKRFTEEWKVPDFETYLQRNGWVK